mmetsp:Transcript_23227/g.41892  ORF Transcript_23227/g.41892 Transcript_23227/m.41892 type:complete len:407 (+) Transcript_23227:363-1583(+)
MQGGGTVPKLGEFRDGLTELALHEISDPLGLLFRVPLQLDFHDAVWELVAELLARLLAAPVPRGAVPLTHHPHVQVQGEPDPGVTRDLERHAGIVRAHRGEEVVLSEPLLDLLKQALLVLNVLWLHLGVGLQTLHKLGRCVLTGDERVDLLAGEDEPLLRAPILDPHLVVDLALHKQQRILVVVPPDADQRGSLLARHAGVEHEKVLVVVVRGLDVGDALAPVGRWVAIGGGVRLEGENGQVLDDDHDDGHHVFGVHPVLDRLALEIGAHLQGLVHALPPQRGVEVAQHQNLSIEARDVKQSVRVEELGEQLQEGKGAVLVVLLDNLVDGQLVDGDVAGEANKLLPQLIGKIGVLLLGRLLTAAGALLLTLPVDQVHKLLVQFVEPPVAVGIDALDLDVQGLHEVV